MKIERERTSSVAKSSDENRAFRTLLQFWIACMSHTALLPAAVQSHERASNNSSSGGGGSNNKKGSKNGAEG